MAHTLDINLRRGHLACELSDQSIFGSIGDALYQLNDLFLRGPGRQNPGRLTHDVRRSVWRAVFLAP